MTVVTEIKGGFGNQLFQFLAGHALSQRLGVEHCIDVSWFDSDHANRKFELNDLPLKHRLIRGVDAIAQRKRIESLDGMRGTISKLPVFRKTLPLKSKHTLIERAMAYEDVHRSLNAPALLVGNFVSERYFAERAPEIAPAIRQWLQERTGKQVVLPERTTVSIHVRLTDYLDPKLKGKFSGSCDITYYRRAISRFRSLFGDCDFWVFSDDIKGARGLLSDQGGLAFVDSDGSDPAIDLIKMMSCHHNIIANSTFSWWGAWLNPNAGKMIIAPRHWFSRGYSRKKDCGDVIPPDWLTLENDSYCS